MEEETPQKDTADNELYERILQAGLENGMYLNDSILVVCGSTSDADVFRKLKFENVTISNLDERIDALENPFEPYKWSFQKAEDLTLEDNSFDWVVVHAGLHHLRCPHKGVAEMMRVATKGIIAIEPHDNWFTRFGVKLGAGQEYETAAVQGNDLLYGGVENTPIPNYVYRWDRKDVMKSIKTLAPEYNHDFLFRYCTAIPTRIYQLKNPIFRIFFSLCGRTLSFLGRHIRFFSNNIAFMVIKRESQMQPWLTKEGEEIVPDKNYFGRMYD